MRSEKGSALILVVIIVMAISAFALRVLQQQHRHIEYLQVQSVATDIKSFLLGMERYYKTTCSLGEVEADVLKHKFTNLTPQLDRLYKINQLLIEATTSTIVLSITFTPVNPSDIGQFSQLYVEGASSTTTQDQVTFKKAISQSSTENRLSWESRLFIGNTRCTNV
jgi:Tfp pilus assembly protein PilE